MYQNNLSKKHLKNSSCFSFLIVHEICCPWAALVCLPLFRGVPGLPSQLSVWSTIQIKMFVGVKRRALVRTRESHTGLRSANFWKQAQFKLLLLKVWWALLMEEEYSHAWGSVDVSVLARSGSKREEAKWGPEVVPYFFLIHLSLGTIYIFCLCHKLFCQKTDTGKITVIWITTSFPSCWNPAEDNTMDLYSVVYKIM